MPTGDDSDELGEFIFAGEDDGGGQNTYATFKAYIADATAGQEAGKIEFAVAEYDGTVTTGLKIDLALILV